ncbi:MAG: ATP-binding cassette domain-containing protein [Betaproteobacteria bacterium]
MAFVLQFSSVTCEEAAGLSFTLAAGEVRVLQVATEAGKTAAADMALGERMADAGSVTFRGRPMDQAEPGQIGWVPAHGGLISNLKIWENVTLPLWYHGERLPVAVEASIARWLDALGLDREAWPDFMASPPARLKSSERKLAGLLRGLVQAPLLLVVDADLFDGVDQAASRSWAAALEAFVREGGGRAVLAVAHGAAPLPWEIIPAAGNRRDT